MIYFLLCCLKRHKKWFNEAHVLLHKCHITTDCGMRCLKPILCRAFETDDTEWIVFSHLYIVCIVYKNGRHSIIFVRNIWARCPGCLGQDVFTCRLSSSHCRSEQQQEHISVSAFACYAKTEGKKRPSNNVCWRRRGETITENTFRQIANMRSKVTAESEGSNITAIWLIATALVTEASHRQNKQSEGELLRRREEIRAF